MSKMKIHKKTIIEFEEEIYTFIQSSTCTCCKQMGQGCSMAYLRTERIKEFISTHFIDNRLLAEELQGMNKERQFPLAELAEDRVYDCDVVSFNEALEAIKKKFLE